MAWLIPFDSLPDPSWFGAQKYHAGGLAVIGPCSISRAFRPIGKSQVAAESAARLDAFTGPHFQPHFLFNALNTIAELVHSRPEQAEEALLDLSDLLRTGLRSEARHTLDQELALVRGYLRIEGLRLGERLDVEWSIDESVDLMTEIPALLIQPLVEKCGPAWHRLASGRRQVDDPS